MIEVPLRHGIMVTAYRHGSGDASCRSILTWLGNGSGAIRSSGGAMDLRAAPMCVRLCLSLWDGAEGTAEGQSPQQRHQSRTWEAVRSGPNPSRGCGPIL